MQIPSICHCFAINVLVHQPESVFSKSVLDGFLLPALKSMYFTLLVCPFFIVILLLICQLFQRTSSGYRADCRTSCLRKLGWLEFIILCIFLLYFLLFQHMLQTHKHALFVARRLHLKVKFKRPRLRCLLRRETEKKTCAVILASHEI